MSSDRGSICEESTRIIVHTATADTVALSPTGGRTTSECFHWALCANYCRNTSVHCSRYARILWIVLYTRLIPDFIFPKSHVIKVLKHYTRSFNTSDSFAEIHCRARCFFLCPSYCLSSSCLHFCNPLFLILPDSGQSLFFQNEAVSFKREYEKLNRQTLLTFDVSWTCALTSLECDVVNMGKIQVRIHMHL